MCYARPVSPPKTSVTPHLTQGHQSTDPNAAVLTRSAKRKRGVGAQTAGGAHGERHLKSLSNCKCGGDPGASPSLTPWGPTHRDQEEGPPPGHTPPPFQNFSTQRSLLQSLGWPRTLSRVRVCVGSCFSSVLLFETPWTAACQAPLFMRFSREEYWSGLLCPPLRNLPNPGIELMSPVSPVLQVDSLPLSQGSLWEPVKLRKHLSTDPISATYLQSGWGKWLLPAGASVSSSVKQGGAGLCSSEEHRLGSQAS